MIFKIRLCIGEEVTAYEQYLRRRHIP
jgi:hypothetical protein